MRARITLTFLLMIPAACVYACGGDDTDNTDGGSDSGPGNDGTVPNDANANKDSNPSNDGSANDTGSDTSTPTDAGTSSDGPSAFACTAPDDCDAGFCCGTIIFNGGALPHCDLQSASASCKTTCKSDVTLSCKTTDTVRGCAAHADCADAGNGYTDCCTVDFSDAAATFCWNAQIATVAGGTCL